MEKPVFKLLLFLKRNPRLSPEAFRELYETVHAPWGLSNMRGSGARRYFRRYATLLGAPRGGATELDFDVVTELWYDDRARLEAVAAVVADDDNTPPIAAPPEATREMMFDWPRTRVVTVVECESDLSGGPSP
jgi:hypothetical protein